MDLLTPDKRSWNMSRIHANDTSIELRLRKALWHSGIRYRKNYKCLPGKPDIVITRYKIVIFCDSSFFHGKDFDTKKKPATNTEYWTKKIKRNIERDREVERELNGLGWRVIRFWDSEINKDLDGCVLAVKEAIFQTKMDDDIGVGENE